MSDNRKHRTFKRWMALFLAVSMTLCTGVMTTDYGLKASDTDTVSSQTAEQVQGEEAQQNDKDTQQVEKLPDQTAASSDAQNPEEKSDALDAEDRTKDTGNVTGETQDDPKTDATDEQKSDKQDPMPAQKFTGKASNGVNVNASVEKGVFPAGTTMKVEAVSTKSAVNSAEKVVDSVETARAVDITFYDKDGNEIQPKDGGSVSVKLSLDKKIKGEHFEVLHKEDNGKVSKVQDVDYARASGASFESDSFSVYIIVSESDPAITTYVFHGNTTESVKVKAGDTLKEPETPVRNNYKFMGWSTEENATEANFDGFGTVSGNQPGQVDLYPVFQKIHYVFFMDGVGDTGRVYMTRGAVEGDTVKTDVQLPLDNAKVTGWYASPDLGTASKVGDTITMGTENVKLYPKVEQGHYVIYDSGEKASSVSSQFVMVGKTTKEPTETPTRKGYTFKHWSETKDGSAYRFGRTINKDITLYAVWTKATTNYTIIHWWQNANDDKYSFKEAGTGSGTTGSMTRVTAKSYDGFTAKAIEQQTINEDGSTVVNVYYDRNKYTLTFQYYDYWYGWSTYDQYTIKAKYGADISAKWPSTSEGLWATKLVYGVATQPYQNGISIMPAGNKTFYLAVKSGNRTFNAKYWVQNEDGEYVIHHTDTFKGSSIYYTTSDDYYDIKGYTVNYDRSTKVGNAFEQVGKTNTYEINIYYDSISYPVTFYVDGQYDSSISKKYGSSLATAEYTPNVPTGYPKGSTFDGWYDNKLLAGDKYDFSKAKMPDEAVNLYGKWNKPVVTVQVHVAVDGVADYSFKLDYDNKISLTDLPTVKDTSGKILSQGNDKNFLEVPDGYRWIGWAQKVDGALIKWNFDVPLHEDLDLYPYYVSTEHYTVSYDLAGGSGEITDSKKYVQHSAADVQSFEGATAPSGKFFLYWEDAQGGRHYPDSTIAVNDNLTLTAHYGEKAKTTDLTYQSNYPSDSGKTDKEYQVKVNGSTDLENNQDLTVESLNTVGFETPSDYYFDGWLNGDSTLQVGQKIGVDNLTDHNVLLANWVKKTEITVKAKDQSKTYDGTALTADNTYELTAGKLKSGHTLSITASGSRTDAGTATKKLESWTIVDANGNDVSKQYKVTKANGTLTVNPKEVTVTAVNAEKMFGEDDPALTATQSDQAAGITYTVTREPGESVRMYTITPSGDELQGNYKVTYVTGTFTIKKSNKLTVEAVGYEGVYDAATHSASATAKVDGNTVEASFLYSLDSGKTWTDKAPSAKDVADSKSFLVKAVKSGYEDSKEAEGTLTILQKDVTVTANDASKMYKTADPTEFTASVTGTLGNDKVTYTVSRAAGEEVGRYVITPTGEESQGNYAVTYIAGYFDITNSDALTVTAINDSRAYNGEPLNGGVASISEEGAAIEYSTDNGETWTNTVPSITNAGTLNYKVRASLTGYDAAIAYGKLTVSKVSLTLTANDNGKEFGADDPALTATLTGTLIGKDKVDYSVSRQTGESVGKYPIKVSVNNVSDNYTVETVPGTFKISENKSMTLTATGYDKPYDGAEHAVQVSCNQTGAIISYSVDNGKTWSTNVPKIKNAGEIKVLVKAELTGYESRTAEATLKVSKLDVTVTPADKSKTFGDSDPTLTATVSGTVKGESIPYTLSRATGEDVGTYQINAAGETSLTNYNVTYNTGTFTINQKEVTVTGGTLSKVYGSADPTLTATVSDSTAAEHITYTLSREQGENAGIYAVIPSGDVSQGNYHVTYANGRLTITQSDAWTLDATGYEGTYDAAEHGPTATPSVKDGTTLYYSTDGGTTWSTDAPVIKNVGEKNVKIKAVNGNYIAITKDDVKLKVNPAAVKVTAENKSKAYGDEDPTFTAIVNGTLGKDKVEYSFTRSPGENPGTYTITVSGETTQGNYTVSYENAALTITKKGQVLSVTASDGNKVYDGTALKAVVTASGAEGITIYYRTSANGKDGWSGWTTDVPEITDVGTLFFQAKAEHPNYEDAVSEVKQLTVTPKPITVKAKDQSKAYGQDDPANAYTATGMVEGHEVDLTVTYSRKKGETVGTYAIKPAGDAVQGNYQIEYQNGILTITKAVGMTLTANGYTGVYDAQSHAVTAESSVKTGNTISYSVDNGESWTTTAPSITDVGTESVLVRLENQNYQTVEQTVTLVVTPKAVTVLPSTDNPESKVYGQDDPTFQMVTSGTLNGDTVEASISREEGENVGTYTVSTSGEAIQGNYSVTYGNATFEITRKAVTVTANNKQKHYGEADPTNDASVSGLERGDEASVLTYSFTRAEGEDVGHYAITPIGEAVQGNYNVTYANGDLEILKSTALTVSAKTKDRAYNGQALTAEYSCEVANVIVRYSILDPETEQWGEWLATAPSQTNVGTLTYKVKVYNSNYEEAISDQATLTVTPKDVTVTAKSYTKKYKESDPMFEADVSGLVGKDQVSYELNRAPGEDVGNYAITASGDEIQGNYKVTYTAGNLQITTSESAQAVTAATLTQEYNGKAIKGSASSTAEGGSTSYLYSVKDPETGDWSAWSENAPTRTDVGTTTYKAKAINGNYEDAESAEATLTITARIVTINVDNKSKTYGAQDPELTASVDRELEGPPVTYTLSREAGEDVNTNGYVINAGDIQANPNYDVRVNTGKLTINKAATLSVSATGVDKVFDGNTYGEAAIASVTKDTTILYQVNGGEWIENFPTVRDVEIKNVNVKAENPNYETATASYTLKITPKTVTVTAKDKTQVYGDEAKTLDADVDGLVGEDTIQYTLSRADAENHNVGTYDITPSGEATQGNYTVQYQTGSYEITARPVKVTAVNSGKVYGETDPTLTAEVDGVLEGESVNYGIERESGENVGTYGITVSGATEQGNYTVSFVPGAFTITASEALTITAANYDAPYDGKSHSGLGTPSVKEGTTVLYKYGNQDWTTTPPSIKNYGEIAYEVKAENPNYKTVTAEGSLKVSRAEATITAEDQTKIYGTEDPELTVRYSGVVEGEQITYTDISREAGEAVKVEGYPITVTGEEIQGNYKVTYVPGVLTITKDATNLKATAIGDEKVYNGQSITASASANASDGTTFQYRVKKDGAWGEWSDEAPSRTNVGSTTFQVKANNPNYESAISDEAVLKVTPKPITVKAVDNGKVYGTEDPALSSTVDGMVENDNFEIVRSVDRETGENVGSYDINVTGEELQGNYKVSYEKGTFTITKASTLTVEAQDVNVVYDGEKHGKAATPSVTEGTTVWYKVGDGEWTQDYPTITNVGSMEVQIEARNDNYETATATQTLTISQRTVTVTLNDASKTFGEDDPELTVKSIENAVDESEIKTQLSREPGENQGTYEINAKTEGTPANYKVVIVPGTFTIQRKEVTVAAQDNSKTYGETDPTLTAKVSGLLGDDSIEYSVSRAPGEDVKADGYPITASGDAEQSNYKVTYTGATFMINKATMTVSYPGYDGSYDGKSHSPEAVPSVTEGSTVWYKVGDGDWTTDVPSIKDHGSKDVQVKVEKPNYVTAYAEGNMTVSRKDATVTALNNSKVYGNDDPKLTAEVTGLVDDTKLDYKVSRDAGEKVGTYPITASGDENQGNYHVSYVPAEFTISSSPMMSITAIGYNDTYDGEEHAASASTTVPDGSATTIEYSVDGGNTWTNEAPKIQDVGEIDFLVRASNENYDTVTASGSLKVSRKSVTITAVDNSKVYGTEDPELTADVEGLVDGDEIQYSLAREKGENTGTYDIKVKAAETQGNYTVKTVPATFTINKSKDWMVTPNGYNGTYDGDEHVAGATPSVTDGTKVYYKVGDGEWTETPPSIQNVGEIPFQIRVENPNYEPIESEGLLKITAKSVTITAKDFQKTYGEDDPELKADVDGLIGDDEIKYSLERVEGEDAGSYAITPSGDEQQGNYSVKFVEGNLEIVPAKVTLTSGSAEREYNRQPLTNDDVTAEGFVGNDGASYEVTGSQTEVGESDNTFTYTLNEDVNPDNYDITVVPGTLKVTAPTYYTLTIHYVDQNGKTVHIDYAQPYLEGDYARINSPIVNGYKTSIPYVEVASMPREDVVVTVYYQEIPKDGGRDPINPTPDNPPAGGGGGAGPAGPGPVAGNLGGAPIVVGDDGTGQAVVTPGGPIETPKGPMKLILDNALPFQLMVLVTILLMLYSMGMKRNQRKIFELRREIERRKS